MEKFKEKQKYDGYDASEPSELVIKRKGGGWLDRDTLINERLAETIDRALATMGRFDTLTITIKVESNEDDK